jgi:hypothetical protein
MRGANRQAWPSYTIADIFSNTRKGLLSSFEFERDGYSVLDLKKGESFICEVRYPKLSSELFCAIGWKIPLNLSLFRRRCGT